MFVATLPRLLLAAALSLGVAATADTPVPPLKSRVTDLTGTLTPDQRAALEAKLATFETKKGSQVAVLIVATIKPETIEQYAIRVADQWKLGRKRVDDGALLIVAKEDRRMRIEVGRGLEGAIPDAIAKRIVSDIIAPRFRENDFYGGITAGVDRILRTIEGEPLPPPPSRPEQGDNANWLELLFFVAIGAYIAGTLLNTLLGRFAGSGVVGAGAGVLGYASNGLAGAVGAGLVALLISLLAGVFRGGSPGSHSGRGWGAGGGGWSSSGGRTSGSSGSWSSGSGGGFSGGGGSFGGGGASGSW